MNSDYSFLSEGYKLYYDYDQLRKSILPTKNIPKLLAYIYILIFIQVIFVIGFLLPILFLLLLPFGFRMLTSKEFLQIFFYLFIIEAVLIFFIIFLLKYRIEIIINNRGIAILNINWFITRRKNYSQEQIRDLRLSGLSTLGALVFSYGTRDIYICPTLSEEDAKQLLLAIHQRFPIYEISNTDEYAQHAAAGDLA